MIRRNKGGNENIPRIKLKLKQNLQELFGWKKGNTKNEVYSYEFPH
jgi:hypothetical protein